MNRANMAKLLLQLATDTNGVLGPPDWEESKTPAEVRKSWIRDGWRIMVYGRAYGFEMWISPVRAGSESGHLCMQVHLGIHHKNISYIIMRAVDQDAGVVFELKFVLNEGEPKLKISQAEGNTLVRGNDLSFEESECDELHVLEFVAAMLPEKVVSFAKV